VIGLRVNSQWAIVIPDALETDSAAPLLCAGVTAWMPFVRHDIGPGRNVAIVGLGGLGHIALQFALALGCIVTVISTSPGKQQVRN
jgi:D-arabinose 1-dehydrogenase-like Zn-dependent alcohol dehydrogenase